MKVLINTRELNYKGGVVNYLKVLNLDAYTDIDYFIISRNKVKSKLLFLLSRYFVFFFKMGQYDIVQLNPSFASNALKRDMIFALIARLRRKKLITFLHGWNNEYEQEILKSKIFKYLFLQTIGKSNAFFVLGQVFKDKLIEIGVDENKSKFYIETMIADDKYLDNQYMLRKKENFLLNNKIWRFLFLSRIVKDKGLELAIETFDLIQNKYPDKKFEFYIAGDGELLPEIKDYVIGKDINNIIFTGFVRDEKKDELLKLCDITFFPTSYGEGLPNTIMEGMLYGMPIVTRNVGGIPHWVKQNVNGFITTSIEQNEFITYIEKLILNPALCVVMSEENHKIAVNNFLKNKVLERHLKHYKEIYEQ